MFLIFSNWASPWDDLKGLYAIPCSNDQSKQRMLSAIETNSPLQPLHKKPITKQMPYASLTSRDSCFNQIDSVYKTVCYTNPIIAIRERMWKYNQTHTCLITSRSHYKNERKKKELYVVKNLTQKVFKRYQRFLF